jgi:hypothetical protein
LEGGVGDKISCKVGYLGDEKETSGWEKKFSKLKTLWAYFSLLGLWFFLSFGLFF